MTDIPPPPPRDLEEQAAAVRNAAELAALGLFVSNAAELSAADLRLLEQIVQDLAIGLTETTLNAAGTAVKAGTVAVIAKQIVDALEDEHYEQLREIAEGIRTANASAPPRDPGELSLARQGARNFATQAYAFTLEHVASRLPKLEGLTLKKTWITQGDSKVRPLHRRLHGRTAPIEGDFWRWPATGQKLRFPGDPLAPPDAVINCRCLCWLSWSQPTDLQSAVRTLPPQEEGLPMAASADP